MKESGIYSVFPILITLVPNQKVERIFPFMEKVKLVNVRGMKEI